MDDNFRICLFDPSVLGKYKDIHEGLTDLKTNLSLCSKNLRLTCKTFDVINKSFHELKEELKHFYKAILKEKFLKFRDDGLHPINGEWGLDKETDSKIAQFMLTEAEATNNPILTSLITMPNDEACRFIRLKIIDLLMFYGAQIDLQVKERGLTALQFAIIYHPHYNNEDMIVKLLAYRVNVNRRPKGVDSALASAVLNHQQDDCNQKDIIVMLLTHGANVNLQSENHNTALTYALSKFSFVYGNNPKKKDIIALLLAYGADTNVKNDQDNGLLDHCSKYVVDFDKLVNDYSPDGSLKKLCIKCILTHQESLEDKLDILPQELRDLFQFNDYRITAAK